MIENQKVARIRNTYNIYLQHLQLNIRTSKNTLTFQHGGNFGLLCTADEHHGKFLVFGAFSLSDVG